MRPRKVIHVDMDAFYASVEQRDDPQLHGKPVIVAWKGNRSVVCAASYEARAFGVRSAMPAVRAERLCPAAVFIAPDFTRYRAVSKSVREIFQRHTDLIEPLSPQSEMTIRKDQDRALHSILYNRPVPVSDAHMLAHARKLKIVALFAVLTGLVCLVGNIATFYLMGAGPFLAFAGAVGMTAFPLGIGHLAYEWIISASRWLKRLVVLVAVVLAVAGVVIAGQARQAMIDRSTATPVVSSYVDGGDGDSHQPIAPPPSGEASETTVRRTLGEGIFLIVLSAELGLAYLIGWLIEFHGDPHNTAWRRLQSIRKELLTIEGRIGELANAPEVAKKCCLAGILAAEASRQQRHPPYHQALTLLLICITVLALPLHAQSVEHYEAILIDTSASISRGGRTNELFHEYLIAVKKLLRNEPPNSRVWVLTISEDSFGQAHEILKGWTPEAHGVFTDDLTRARTELASSFERKSSGLSPMAAATDIFGALWHVKAIFESGARPNTAAPMSKSIVLFSDMMNDTKAFPMPELLELGPAKMLERAKGSQFIAPLTGYKIYVHGASTEGLSPREWSIVKDFWTRYFAVGGGELVSYSIDCDQSR